jgi:hypothetical protein
MSYLSGSMTSSETVVQNREQHPNSLANLRPFAPGQSGNPGGRPKKAKAAADKAADHASEAIDALLEVLRDETAPHASKVSAATQILDRGIGRSIQPVDVEHRHTLSDELENIIREINGEPPLTIEHE